MDAPWFDPNTFGAWFGAIVGGGGGTLCGLWGALCGFLCPRGKGRKVILGGMFVFVVLGLILGGVGLYAFFSGQPYGIWYPFLLTGFVLAVVNGVLIPVIRKNYEQAENRRIAAESIRVG
ncbi:hypothetical protein Enr10x_15760 [Gimesia panareensis]|uniref:Major facilitator superfamily (MFS) profile domain-containing protein n=1 Tax=Gimesia panareensis TaxID=2527978 RepID=A0A517Q3S1_9PLAN|nr:hypothetical protein [Gimesia panareensis]QDT26275.1 hypothetical protein Enr10x_15760 [Gimesia panareensis]